MSTAWRWLLVALATLVAAPPARAAEPTPVTVDLLVLYTPRVTARYGSGVDTRLNHLVNVSNDIYRRSEAGVRIRIVARREVAYSDTVDSDTALDALTDNAGVFSGVESERASVGADLVVLMRRYAGDGVCGIAWLGGYRTNGDFSFSRRYGYSHVSIDCPDDTLTHELGHNMGLSHSRRQDGRGATFPWSLGHGVDGRFATVMAYASAFSAPPVALLASPALVCNGLPCGVDRSDPVAGADAVHTLRESRTQIAAYLPTAVAPPPPPPPPTDPPVETHSVTLTEPEQVRPNATVTVAWERSAEVASVDLFWRYEVRRKNRRWRVTDWQLLSAGDADGTHAWEVPNLGSRKRKTRVRFLLTARDGSGAELTSELTSAYRLPKKKRRR